MFFFVALIKFFTPRISNDKKCNDHTDSPQNGTITLSLSTVGSSQGQKTLFTHKTTITLDIKMKLHAAS